MKLSAKARYAVMAMVDLAINGSCGPVCLANISEREEISLAYLEQLFAKLRRAGLVESVRGPGGGYRLGRCPEQIRICDIVTAVDESLHATRCEPGSATGCRGGGARCLTHDLWAELGNQISLFLNAVSLADVVHGRVLGTSGRVFAEARERATA